MLIRRYFQRSKSTLDSLKSVFNAFRSKPSLGAPGIWKSKGLKSGRSGASPSSGSRPWDKERRSPRPWNKGRARSPKFFFRPFGPQFSLKIRGRWVPRTPPLDPPLAQYKNLLNAPTNPLTFRDSSYAIWRAKRINKVHRAQLNLTVVWARNSLQLSLTPSQEIFETADSRECTNFARTHDYYFI